MNSMNDERFFDLAMKAIARQATPAERAELDAALASNPARRTEWEQLQSQARLAKEVLPLAAAVESAQGELPAYARGRLQTKVRETLGRPAAPERSKGWGWRLFLVLTPAAAVVLGLLTVLFFKPAEPLIQVAMLDTTGGTRGAVTNELALLNQAWKSGPAQGFVKGEDLEAWEKVWPAKKVVVKVVYDRTAAEVRVTGIAKGRRFQKTFPVEDDLAAALRLAAEFIRSNLE